MSLAHRAANFTRAYPVLYVDDEPDNLLVFQATFRDEFEVLTAGSTEEAIELIATVPIAVLLADQRMPGRSGVELCEELRASHPTIVRMLITAYSDTEVAIAAINRGGVSRYINKPWQAEEVRQILREAIARAHLERMVAKLRASILDKERIVGSQAVTMRLLHDVAETNASIEGCCDNLEALSERLHARVDQATFASYLDEVGDLRNFVDFLADLRTRGAAGIHGDGNRLQRRDVPVDELLRVVVELARREQAGVASVSARCEPGVTAWADRTDLSRILLNLTRSAGRGLREAGRKNGHIAIEARTEGGTTAIVVRDDELGVTDPEVLLTAAKGGGRRGFELVVARELALTHGGTLELIGGDRVGWTSWQISLPARDAGTS
mgnify:CR=1 FL=1